MTEEQKKLVEENHKLIYSFLNRKKLPEDEFYDMFAIVLCKAAIAYNPSKGEFSTLAINAMKNKLKDYYKERNRKQIIPDDNLIYYDAIVDSDSSGNTYSDCTDLLKDNFDLEEDLIQRQHYQKIMSIFSDVEKRVINGIIKGMTMKEIGEQYGVSIKSIRCTKEKVKKKLKNIITNKDE